MIMKNKKEKGFIAMTSVLIIAAVVLVIGVSVTMLSIGEGQSGLTLFKGEETLTLVEGCMEDALLKIRQDINYSGGSISRPEGTCLITLSKTGNTWTINSTTVLSQYKRTIQAIVNRGGSISISSWKEI